MFSKSRLQDKSPGIKRSIPQPSRVSGEIAPVTLARPAKPQVAVFITHGMGQQVPFETIDSVVEGLMHAADRHGNSVTSIRASTIQIDEIKTQRAEFDMRDAQGRDIEVHVYEGYWAPYTEGQVTLRDVMWFLIKAGRKGLCNCFVPFKRWIFGSAVSFGTQRRAAFRLLMTLGVLFSLVVLNFITAVVSGDKFIHHNATPYFSESIFVALTTVVGLYVLACIVFGGSLTILMKSKKYMGNPKNSSAWQLATGTVQLMMWVWMALTIISAIALLLLAAGYLQPERVSSACISKYWLPIWGTLFFASMYVRNVLVQYMGDVAAYVDSHSLDRFNDIRTRIKANVFEQAKANYTQQYEHIAMVGHSLGSVITYDTLNALINHDQLNANALDVIKRTKLLLTFGSPLDKTAFVFASQKSETSDTREALAATLQPMIQTYDPYRDINWINVYSPRDIISGKLEFYDDQDAADYNVTRRVNNVIDRDAMIPLAAHIEYWNNTTLFDQLYANL